MGRVSFSLTEFLAFETEKKKIDFLQEINLCSYKTEIIFKLMQYF